MPDVLTSPPAFKAALSSESAVRRIEDTPAKAKPLKDCVEMLRGAAGSKVKLELVDTANRRTNTVELTRATIPLYG